MNRRLLLSTSVLLVGSFTSDISAHAKAGASKRTALINTLIDCARRYPKANCESVVDRAIVLFQRGDNSVLKPLMDLGLKSNNHLSETLGIFFGEEVLARNPRLFLSLLTTRPRKEQIDLAFLAGAMDGGGMDEEMLRKVRANLRAISRLRHDPLARTAKLCLSSVIAVNDRINEITKTVR